MKVLPIREAKAKLSQWIEAAQEERILITRHGKPMALLSGVSGYDMEQVMLLSNPKFWKLIEERRGQKTLSRSELEKKLKG